MILQRLLEETSRTELLRFQQELIETLDDVWEVVLQTGELGTPEIQLTRPGKINAVKVLVIADFENLVIHSTLSDDKGVGIADKMPSAKELFEITVAVCRGADLGVMLSASKKVSGFKFDLHIGCIGALFDHSRFGGMGCWFDKKKLTWNMTCQGHKNDIDVGEDMTDEWPLLSRCR